MRFRIQPDREYRDDDAMIAHVAPETWDCFCGAQNSVNDPFCQWCKNLMGEWQCECAHLNPLGAVVCQECGKAKE